MKVAPGQGTRKELVLLMIGLGSSVDGSMVTVEGGVMAVDAIELLSWCRKNSGSSSSRAMMRSVDWGF